MKIHTDKYTFPLNISEMYGIKEAIYVGNPRNRPYPCVIVHIHDDDNDATLADVKFASTCSTNKQLIQGAGTIEMIMATLKFAILRNPHLEKIVLVDESHIPISNELNIEITARRLLTGKLGWYEEYLGAKPYGLDADFIKKIRKTKINMQFPEDEHYWTATNANKISNKLFHRSVVGTNWCISKNTIINYPIQIRIEQDGGGNQFKKWSHQQKHQL